MALIIAVIAVCIVVFIIFLSCCLHFIYTIVKQYPHYGDYKNPNSDVSNRYYTDWGRGCASDKEERSGTSKLMSSGKTSESSKTSGFLYRRSSKQKELVEAQTQYFMQQPYKVNMDIQRAASASFVTIEEVNSPVKKNIMLSNVVVAGSFVPEDDETHTTDYFN